MASSASAASAGSSLMSKYISQVRADLQRQRPEAREAWLKAEMDTLQLGSSHEGKPSAREVCKYLNRGQVIGLIMLLLAMLPRDIRSDLVDRLHRMTTQEMVDWYRTSTAASSERAGNSTVDPTSEGEIPESAPPATSGEYISEAEMSEPFGDERN